MLDKKTFMKEYRITEEEFLEADMAWSELEAIYEDYQGKTELLKEIGKEFVNDYLYDIEKAGIHSYRYRTKDPEHLIDKIIRKRREDKEKFAHVNMENYHKYFTDLIGIRVFFLYREDWRDFHNYITNIFENNPLLYVQNRLEDFDKNPEHYYIAERPKVYKRSGDEKIYDREMLDIHSGGIYRSLHYIIKYKGYYVEIQCRTLFEEGWGEVDHDIVYPYFQDDEMLKDFSTILNRLSGMADEMSSYFRRIKKEREKGD